MGFRVWPVGCKNWGVGIGVTSIQVTSPMATPCQVSLLGSHALGSSRVHGLGWGVPKRMKSAPPEQWIRFVPKSLTWTISTKSPVPAKWTVQHLALIVGCVPYSLDCGTLERELIFSRSGRTYDRWRLAGGGRKGKRCPSSSSPVSCPTLARARPPPGSNDTSSATQARRVKHF